MATETRQSLEGSSLGAILSKPSIRVELTHGPLNALTIMQHVRSPLAGATVLFAGTPSLFHYSHQPLQASDSCLPAQAQHATALIRNP